MQKYRSIYLLLQLACSVSFGTLGQSYSLNYMNDALDTILLLLGLKEPYLGLKEGIVVSSLIVGAFFGCLISFKLFPSLPRRRSLLILDLGFIIGSGMSLYPNVYTMVISRFIQGMSCGMGSILLPLMLKEFSPIEIYSIIGGQNLVFYSFGIIICNSTGLFFQDTKNLTKEEVNPYFWRIYFIMPGVFSLIRQFLFTVIFTFDTPEYNMKMGNEQAVRDFIAKYYRDEYAEEIYQYYYQLNEIRHQKKSSLKMLFSKTYYKRTELGIVINIAQQLTGINVLISYSTTIFEQIMAVEYARLNTLMIAILRVFMYSSAVIVWQKFGRRIPVLSGTLIMIFSQLALAAASFNHNQDQKPSLFFVSIIVGSVFIFFIGYFHSLGMLQVYQAEFLPEIGQIFTLSIQWIICIIITLTFPIIENKFGITICFGGYSVLTIICVIYMFIYAKETKGLTETQIRQKFDGKHYEKLESSIVDNSTESENNVQ